MPGRTFASWALFCILRQSLIAAASASMKEDDIWQDAAPTVARAGGSQAGVALHLQ
jgi:hypothetical protein